jgi:hypothetical protein
MKKLLLLTIISVSLSLSSEAQVEKGNFLLNLGIGANYYYAGGVPLMVSGEYAFSDVLSIGPYLSYTSWNRGYVGNDLNYSFIDFGVRASYHFNEVFKINVDELDIYGGGFLGLVTSNYDYDGPGNYRDDYDGGVRAGIHAGARYFFAPKVAGYAELGVGYVSASIGVTFKF